MTGGGIGGSGAIMRPRLPETLSLTSNRTLGSCPEEQVGWHLHDGIRCIRRHPLWVSRVTVWNRDEIVAVTNSSLLLPTFTSDLPVAAMTLGQSVASRSCPTSCRRSVLWASEQTVVTASAQEISPLSYPSFPLVPSSVPSWL